MKKVCHIISAFDRYDVRIFEKQSHALIEAGYEVFILTNDSNPSEIIDRIQIISCMQEQNSRIRRIISSSNLFYKKAIEIDADIYQIHDPELIYLGVKLKKLGKKIVYDAHEDFSNQILEKKYIPYIFRKMLSEISKIYLQLFLKKYDIIISVTPHIVAKLKKLNSNTFCITNYPIISEKLIHPIKLNDYIDKKNLMCYSGTVYRSSLPENVINAIKGIKNINFKIFGPIEKKYKDELFPYFNRENVQYLSTVSRNEVNKIYIESSIGIAIFDYSPNLGFKTGSLGVNKLFEYMLFGLPIICTDFELWKEIIDKYNCGIYVNPHNIDEIREAILFLINNKDKAYEMGQNGRKAILEHYNWETQKEIYLRLYKDLSNEIIAG